MAEDGQARPSFASSRSDKRRKSGVSLQPTIELKDNTGDVEEISPVEPSPTASTAPSAGTAPASNLKPSGENGHGIRHSRGESLRIALGHGKYKKWSEQEYEDMAKKRAKRALSKARSAISKASTEISRDGGTADEDFKPEEEIDVLYENQRGSFIFGIPLFSSRTLLNFDPSPWTHQNGKDSAVNISNAQLPDPSWKWAWKNWYIDMGGDVDDNGWQYSFSFSKWFSWHGTHVFFNSFVRRRRWVRKRLRYPDHRLSRRTSLARSRASEEGRSVASTKQSPHHLNPDYFSIHTDKPKYKQTNAFRRSVASGTLGGAGWGEPQSDSDSDEEEAEIRNVPQLMKALRAARLDRERVAAVERFAIEGGEEVHYLAERIPAIMNLFIFQSSRRHLLEALQRAYAAIDNASGVSTPKSPHPLSIISNNNSGLLYSPAQSSPQIKITTSSQESLPLPAAASNPTTSNDSPQVSPLTRRPTIPKHKKTLIEAYKTSLKIAIDSAEAAIKKLEFWSDADENKLPSPANAEPFVQVPKVWKGKERAP